MLCKRLESEKKNCEGQAFVIHNNSYPIDTDGFRLLILNKCFIGHVVFA